MSHQELSFEVKWDQIPRWLWLSPHGCDDIHKFSDSEVDYMCKARQAVLVSIERVDSTGSEGHFNIVACFIIVACVVGCHAKKLLKAESVSIDTIEKSVY